MTQPNIDTAAHVGGLAGGFLGGLLSSQPITRASLAGRPFRNILMVGFGLLLVIGGMIAVSARHESASQVYRHGATEVYYMDGATKAEAERLCSFIESTAGSGPEGQTFELKKTSTGYLVRMVVKKEFQNDQKVLRGLQIDCARMSSNVFDGAAVELQVCDDGLKTLKTLQPLTDLRYSVVEGKAEVFFAAVTDKEDALRLAKHLARMIGDSAAQISFKLAKRSEVVEIHLVLQPHILDDPATIADLRRDRNDIAVNIFPGATVEFHLCDELFNVVRILNP